MIIDTQEKKKHKNNEIITFKANNNKNVSTL